MGFESNAEEQADEVVAELIAVVTGDMVRVRLVDPDEQPPTPGSEVVVLIDGERVVGSILLMEDDEHASVLLDRVAMTQAVSLEQERREASVDNENPMVEAFRRGY